MSRTRTQPIVLRLSLITVILAGLATAGLELTWLRDRIATLRGELATRTKALQRAETELTSARRELAATTTTLKQTAATLEAATADKQKALAAAAAQSARVQRLSEDLARNQQDLSETQARLAQYRAAGLEPEQIVTAATQLRELQRSLDAAREANAHLAAQVKQLTTVEAGPVYLPASLRAKVLACDPKWHFIVLDAGETAGVLEAGEVLVSRQGKLLGRAKVRRVQKDSCVADLLPGWQLGEIVEGDIAIAAFPHS